MRKTILFGVFVLLLSLSAFWASPGISEPIRVRQFATQGTDNTTTIGFRLSKETASVSMSIDNTLATTKVHVNVSMDDAATYVPFHTAMGNADTTTLWETVSGTAAHAVPWPPGLVNFRWFKIVCADNQAVPKTFTIYERTN